MQAFGISKNGPGFVRVLAYWKRWVVFTVKLTDFGVECERPDIGVRRATLEIRFGWNDMVWNFGKRLQNT